MPIIKGDFILKITNFFRIINTKNPKKIYSKRLCLSFLTSSIFPALGK